MVARVAALSHNHEEGRMRGTLRGFLTAAVVVVGAAPLSGQKFHVGGGVTMPSGDYGNFAKTGYLAIAGLTFDIPAAPIAVRVDGMYGANTHDGGLDEKTSIYGGMANAVWGFLPGSPLQPYAIGGLGYLSHDYDPGSSGSSADVEWAMVWGVGGGVNFALGGLGLFAEGRYLDRDGTAFLALLAGLRFGGK